MRIPRFEAQTEWVKPTEFPDLRQVDEIAIDLETKDPDLIKKGSGSIIGNGEVIGIAVATSYYKGYFPIAHEGGGNMEKAKHYIDMIIERDYGPQESWIDGYNKWKELRDKGVVNGKVKLGDLKKLIKKERCPHN